MLPNRTRSPTSRPVRVMNITIQTTHLNVTDGTRRLVERKIAAALRPLGPAPPTPIDVAVELERAPWRYGLTAVHDQTTRPYHAAVTVSLSGTTLHAEGSAPDLRRSLTGMKRELARQIRSRYLNSRPVRSTRDRATGRASAMLRWDERDAL
jgi:ribosome-associated translation inhibitor RaiA